jgi:hypothetical protein
MQIFFSEYFQPALLTCATEAAAAAEVGHAQPSHGTTRASSGMMRGAIMIAGGLKQLPVGRRPRCNHSGFE